MDNKRVITSILLIFASIFLMNFVCASPSAILTKSAGHGIVNITGAINSYSYEIALNFTGSITNVVQTEFLGSESGGIATYGTQTKGDVLYVYGSRLDNTAAGVTSENSELFSFDYTGDVDLYSYTAVSNLGVETGKEIFAPNCGDGVCNNGETCSSCSDDCGACPSIAPIVVASGGGTTTKLEYYSLKLVTPGDVVVSDENYIEVPLMIQNLGNIDMSGISLSAKVLFNDQETRDLEVVLAKTYINSIAAGSSQNITLKISANTRNFGTYKITVFAEVESPKLSDYGDFYIEIKKVNASQSEQNLIFAEKLISQNSDCLELTEQIKEARELYEQGDYQGSNLKSREAINLCTNIITQQRPLHLTTEGGAGILYLAVVITLIVLLLGILFYIYRKARGR